MVQYKNLNITKKQRNYYEDRDELNIVLPSVAIDLMIFAQKDNQLYLLMQQDQNKDYFLVGSFMQAHQTIEENIQSIIKSKTDLKQEINDYQQIKTYTHPNRDDRGHIITILYAVFIDFELSSKAHWLKVSTGPDIICLANNTGPVIQIDYQGQSQGQIKYTNIEGHGYMIAETIKQLIDQFFKTGQLLNVYKNGFTIQDAWLLYESLTNENSTRTNVRRKLLKIIKIIPGRIRRNGTSYAQVYTI